MRRCPDQRCRQARAVALVFITAAGGCAVIPEQQPAHPVEARPAELLQYYSYTPITAPPVFTDVEDRVDYRVRVVDLMPPTGTVTNSATRPQQSIQIVWYEPKTSRPAPLILITPISGSNTMFVDGFAESFVRSGYHAAIIRKLRFRFDGDKPLTQVEDYLRAAVIRHRQVLDWLLSQPNVDTNRVATFGISRGAIINAVAAGVDARIRVNVFALAGAPIADVVETSAEHSLRRYWDKARRHHQLTDAQLQDALRQAIRSDPIRVAPYIDRDNVLMIIALFDRSVGTDNSMRLWRALGEPDALFVPFGHYTTILAMPNLRYAVNRYFHDKFDPPPVGGNRGYLYRKPQTPP